MFGGILSYLQDILGGGGGFCPRQQKRVEGILSGGGGDFVRSPANVNELQNHV